MKILFGTLVFLLASAVSASAHVDEREKIGRVSTEKPAEVADIGIDEKLGTQLDWDVPVVNEKGETVPLRSVFPSGRPTIFSLVYYSCPGLCNYHLNGLYDALKQLDWKAGQQFETVALSFDAKEKTDLAVAKKKAYLQLYGRPGVDDHVHFLTATQASIDRITRSVGFKYRWDKESNQWAHASAAIVVSPEGKLTRYVHGIIFHEKDLRLAITEGGQGKVGTLLDQMIWYCFQWDPKQSKYAFYSFRLVQVAAALTALLLAFLLAPYVRQLAKRGT